MMVTMVTEVIRTLTVYEPYSFRIYVVLCCATRGLYVLCGTTDLGSARISKQFSTVPSQCLAFRLNNTVCCFCYMNDELRYCRCMIPMQENKLLDNINTYCEFRT